MKFKWFFAILLFALSTSAFSSFLTIRANGVRASAQEQTGALQRGYGAGYSDGYQSGWGDSADGATRDYRNKNDYRQADRAYAAAHGSREDYRDGYRQGFARGYEAGYDRRAFDSTIPPGLARINATAAAVTQNSEVSGEAAAVADVEVVALQIPANAEMRIELLNNLGTNVNVRGDRFQARVLDPVDYKDAIIEGRVVSARRPGRVRGTAELQLSFDAIRLPDNRSANLKAQVVEVIETRGETGAGGADREGGVRGRSSTVGDAIKVGTGAAVGAVIGAITGGGKGAGVGAVVGGAIGAGGVLSTRGKEISLPRGTQLRIRTVNETRID